MPEWWSYRRRARIGSWRKVFISSSFIICRVGYKFEIWGMPSWLETAMVVFFCENTYKNTLKNVTTNREVFLNFSAEPPRKNPLKMKWLLEGYFCVCPRNNSLENIRIYERDFELSQIYFQKGVSFCCQNVRINRRVCFDRPKGGDRNQRENPRDDLLPIPQS